MALRYLHKSWKYFWKIILSLFVIIIVLGGAGFGLLQLDATKDIIVEKIENNFQENFNGKLSIGDVDGLLPFNAEFKNVVLTSSADSLTADTLASFKSAKVGIDVWALLQRNLKITEFSLNKPSIRLLSNGEGGYTLSHALEKKTKSDSSSSGGLPIKKITITAPQLSIHNGSVYIEKLHSSSSKVNLPSPLRIRDINAQLFVNLTKQHRTAEIEHFSATIPSLKAGKLSMHGQVYNDDHLLEFNSFHFTAGSSHLHLNGSINGIDLYAGDLNKQLKNADYDMEVSSHRLKLSEFTDLLPNLPDIKKPFKFTVKTNGNRSLMKLNTLSVGMGESHFSIEGAVRHLLKNKQLSYNFKIDTLAARTEDVKRLTSALSEGQYRAIHKLHLNGQASGTLDSLRVNLDGKSTLGSFQFDGNVQLKNPHRYKGMLALNDFDIAPLTGSKIDTSRITFRGDIAGQNTSLKSGRLKFTGTAKNSFVNQVPIDSLRLSTSLVQGELQTSYYYRNKRQLVQGNASADFKKDDPPITLRGTTRNLNVPVFLPNTSFDSTRLNTDYNIDIQGIKPDRIQGMVKIEVKKSLINGDSVQAHHINIQLDSPDQPMRTLKVRSSLFDLTMTGDLKPKNITHETTYWTNYFKKRIDREVKFDTTKFVPANSAPQVQPLQIKAQIQAKNLSLLRKYFPGFPSLQTDSRLHFNLKADASKLQFSSDLRADSLRLNTVHVRGVGSSLSGHFNHNETLKKSGNLTFQTNAKGIESKLIKMDSVNVHLQYAKDSLFYSQQVKRFAKSAHFNVKVRSKLTKQNLKVSIDNFFLGSNKYGWRNQGTPQLTYNRAKKVIFSDFRFKNENELFALKGALSPDRSDTLQTVLRDVQLGRISNLIKGKFDFSGTLNGKLQTRSLTRKPTIQGNLKVDSLKLQDRLLGDLTFNSSFNESKDRFDIQLNLLTDSTKYQHYLKANNGLGQNIAINGYFKPSNIKAKKDSVFHLNANFKEVDLWVVRVFLDNIFNNLQGRATGKGMIAGNFSNINFNADFKLHHVYAVPKFLQTNYYLDGGVHLSDANGVRLENIKIEDKKGGTGTLSGLIDLNHFDPIKYLDLTMTLHDLQFLNSGYSADNPFFGSMYGSGKIRLKGPTTNLNLTSLQDIHIAQNSVFGLPLTSKTELNANNNFIKFVDSFQNPSKRKVNLSEQNFNFESLGKEAQLKAIENLSFGERFNIDIQFVAPKPIDARIIFDPVTNEELHASGTGRLRVSLQQGNLQLFGNFNITGGTYQFVSGEIFARKLDLRSGGNITWEGPADDARLNVDAVYHARPTLQSLNNISNNNANSGATQRVPINLIVELSGTLNDIQNSYHFEVPQTFQGNSVSTFKYRLNQINSDKQQKLLQATSILLTGNFLATPGAGESQTSQLSSSLAKSSTFINPLLSNQVISPLLSNQINSLLKGSANVNVNFNLNQYNQVDLGVALQLYNDKLTLQREGYLTGGGQNSTFGEQIGDLKAIYHIHPNLSVTAFHRQDETLGSLVANGQTSLSPTVNGAGVQTSIQFNTWQQLAHKVHNFFRRLFGKDEIDYKQHAAAETKSDSTKTAKK